MAKTTENTIEGVPSTLNIDFAKVWVKKRVSQKRFEHITGVAKVARDLADESCLDVRAAELAAWLHDACKEFKDTELVLQAKSFGMKLNALEEKNGHLLHGPVAAFTIKKEFGVTNEEILDAISEHTLGAVDMCDLSKVVFLADCLEPSRPKEYTDPIWAALKPKNADSQFDFDHAILIACDLNLKHVIETKRVIHPRTVDVYNHFLNKIRQRDRS